MTGWSSPAGQLASLAVDRPAGRDVHEPLGTGAAGRFERGDRAADVDIGVEARIAHRNADVDLCSEVEDGLGPGGIEDPCQPGRVADIRLDQLGAARDRVAQVLAATGREIVHDRDRVATLDQRIDEVRADEAGAACDEGPQGAGS